MRPFFAAALLCLLPLRAFGAAPAQASVATGTSTGVSGGVQLIPLAVPGPAAAMADRTKTVAVPGDGSWVDTGLAVGPADTLAVTASGSITLADGRTSTPDGLARGWKDLLRQFPLESGAVGSLIGRVGGLQYAVPFAVGTTLSRRVPATGELFLAANTGTQLAGTGSYTAQLTLRRAPAAAAAAAPVDLQQVLTPSLFASTPRRVSDNLGNAGDMVNFALLGTEADVKAAFAAAGWIPVDKTTNDAVVHGLLATLSKKAYLAMPMSTLYLFGRPQDLSYARADPLMVALERHHLRVWNTGRTVAGRPLWVGSATHDTGLARDDRNNGVTHEIDPDIDAERSFLESTFAAAGVLAGAAYVSPADPLREARTATGESFHSDGRIVVLLLQPQA